MPKISGFIIAKEPVAEVLEAIKNIYDCADEVLVIYQDRKEFDALRAAAGQKTRVYYAPALGLAEVYKAYAESLCSNDCIISIDTDERFNEYTLKNLGDLFAKPGIVAFRIRRREGKGHTWQYRIWKKGSLRWNGMMHEHPEILAKQMDLGKQFELYHDHNPNNVRNYDLLVPYQDKSPLKLAMEAFAINLISTKRINPGIFFGTYKRYRQMQSNMTELDKRLKQQIAAQGVARIIGSDTQAGVDELIRNYGDREGDTALLVQVLKDKCK